MYIVYLLKSKIKQKSYVGITNNINRRLKEHNCGKVRSTKSRKPLRLIFKEEYINKFEAFKKERYYKTVKGKKELKTKISNCGVV